MSDILSMKDVATLVAERSFDTMTAMAIKETAIGWQIDGCYCGMSAQVRVYMNGPMMIVKMNSSDDLNGYTINMPIIPEDATADRINKHMDYMWDEQ